MIEIIFWELDIEILAINGHFRIIFAEPIFSLPSLAFLLIDIKVHIVNHFVGKEAHIDRFKLYGLIDANAHESRAEEIHNHREKVRVEG